ncbi:MAG: hypothetical protein GY841_04115 [FCB group bacterium]|nr:hypothetical protein [FCB group bacterium]
MAYDTLGQRSFSYQDVDRSSLEFAGFVEPLFSWQFEQIDEQGSPMQPSIGFDSEGSLLASYHDDAIGWLKLASRNLGIWNTQTVDSSGDVGGGSSLPRSVTDSSRMISYYDATHGYLKIGISSTLEASIVQVVPDPVIFISPAGSIVYQVKLQDQSGQPLQGWWDIQLDFTAVTGVTPCPDGFPWPLITTPGPSDSNGIVRFYLPLIGCSSERVAVTSFGDTVALVPIRSLDQNGSSYVSAHDFVGHECNDYDNDGLITNNDWTVFKNHIGETCLSDPYDFVSINLYTIPGPSDIYQGDTIQVCASFVNTFGCALQLDSVIFSSAHWGIAHQFSEFARAAQIPIPARDTLIICEPFAVPMDGHGCFSIDAYVGLPVPYEKQGNLAAISQADSVIYGVRTDPLGVFELYIGLTSGQDFVSIVFDTLSEEEDYSKMRFMGLTAQDMRMLAGLPNEEIVLLLQSDLAAEAAFLGETGFPEFEGTESQRQILARQSEILSFIRNRSGVSSSGLLRDTCENVCPPSDWECSPSWVPEFNFLECCIAHDGCFEDVCNSSCLACNAELYWCILEKLSLGGYPPDQAKAIADIYLVATSTVGCWMFHRCKACRCSDQQPDPGNRVQRNVDARSRLQRSWPKSAFAMDDSNKEGKSTLISDLRQTAQSGIATDSITRMIVPIGTDEGDKLMISFVRLLPEGWSCNVDLPQIVVPPDTMVIEIYHPDGISPGDTGLVSVQASHMDETYAGEAELLVYWVHVCGDANGDDAINVGDAVYLINYIFKSGPAPEPLEGGETNCDGAINVGDAVYLINYVFKSGPEPCCP